MTDPDRLALTRADRVACEHSAGCPGCPLIDLSYAQQLEAKRRRVSDALAPYAVLDGVQTAPAEPADPIVSYRTRAKLVVGVDGALGLYARGGGHEVTDIPGCRVMAPVLAKVAAELRARIARALRDGGVLAPARPGGGALRAVDLREVRDGDGPAGALVTWVFDRERAPHRLALEEAAASLCKAMREVVGVAANFQREGAAQILGGETVALAGGATAPDRVGAFRHLATFGSFVQAHRGQAAKIHRAVGEAVRSLGPNPRVLDLYAGSGAIALGLAAGGARVLMVESFAPAVAQAEAAARSARLDLTAERADAARRVDALAAAGETFDAVVLNPPRRGASPAVREGLARLGPRLIAYVSCDPQTLARDLARLAELGYRAATVRPYDMIPLSAEVEAIALLERGPAPAPRILFEDDTVLVVDKGPHEPLGREPRRGSSLTERVRAMPGAAQAAAVLDLDADASGIVVYARTAEHVAPWSAALRLPSTCVQFVVGVRGILRAKGNVVRPVRGERRPGPARMRYVRSAVFSGHSLARATPDTLAADTVRRHLAAVGHPVLGDERAGDRATNRHFAERAGLDRAFVHRARLEVDHPVGGARLVVDAPLAGDLQAVLDRYPPAVKPRP